MALVDIDDLEVKVREIYRLVAEQPDRAYHFEMGRALADRLGYPTEILDRLPVGAVESFAGVGYFFDLAGLVEGERVIDLGSGSGMDAFAAAHLVGPSGRVLGVDFTVEQLDKARRLASREELDHVEFAEAGSRACRPGMRVSTASSPTASSTSHRARSGFSPRRRGSCGRVAGWPSLTSSPSVS